MTKPSEMDLIRPIPVLQTRRGHEQLEPSVNDHQSGRLLEGSNTGTVINEFFVDYADWLDFDA